MCACVRECEARVCVSGVSVLRVGAFVFVLLEEAEGRGFRP
jgi:hypothetical protein